MGSGGQEKSKISTYSILDSVSYLLVFLAVISFMLSSITLLPTPIGIVTSGSMEPLMSVGDLVFIQPADIGEIRVGDIIAYNAPPDKTVIHRVVGVTRLPGKIYLATKGDANPVTDQSVGYPPVSIGNLIGKVFCLDGFPFKIPFVGIYIIHARNFAIWLTQNKIWSFWGPLVVIVYALGPSLTPRGILQFDLRKSLRTRIPVRRLLLYSLVAFIGISAFTFYFKTETYSLSMRVACLLEDKEPAYISFGSMTYEEVKNNTIEVTGAPMFPVKTVAIILGNASRLIDPIPAAMKVEPMEFEELNLRAAIPPRGQVEPGIYKANVHIFSDTLLLLLPDSMIFSLFYVIRNPWISLILLDILVALALSLTIALLALGINYTSEQILYTIVWNDKIKATPPHLLRIKIHNFRKKMSNLSKRLPVKTKFVSFIKHEAYLNKIWKLSALTALPSAILFLLVDDLLLPVLVLGLSLNLLFRKLYTKGSENLVAPAAFANLLLALTFIARRAIIVLYSQINLLWCVISAGFVGNLAYVVTAPLVIIITLSLFLFFRWSKVWYLEYQTINRSKLRAGEEVTIEKRIKIPSLEDSMKFRRKIVAGLPKAPSEVVLALRKILKCLNIFGKDIVSSLSAFRDYTAFSFGKAIGTRLIDMNNMVKNLWAAIRSIGSSIVHNVTDTICLICLSVKETVRIIRWRLTS